MFQVSVTNVSWLQFFSRHRYFHLSPSSISEPPPPFSKLMIEAHSQNLLTFTFLLQDLVTLVCSVRFTLLEHPQNSFVVFLPKFISFLLEPTTLYNRRTVYISTLCWAWKLSAGDLNKSSTLFTVFHSLWR